MSPATLQLTGARDEAGIARLFVQQALRGAPSDLCDDVVLLTSELVSNVIRHGQVPARLEISIDGHRFHVVVHDSSEVLPLAPPEAARVDSGSSSGRGLAIVAAIAQAWGVSTEIGILGKGVWFDVGPAAKRSPPMASI